MRQRRCGGPVRGLDKQGSNWPPALISRTQAAIKKRANGGRNPTARKVPAIGIEHIDDLLADLEQALAAV
jgi:O-acetylhomoserine/O-acetylserine sulfhydrylase-like pyridoxal-dependent enzyme